MDNQVRLQLFVLAYNLANEAPVLPEKDDGCPEKGLVNLWGRKKITEKPHAGRGQATKCEMSDNGCFLWAVAWWKA